LKRFRFRLEQVLRVRRLQEDIARGALMHANHHARVAATAVNARVEEYTTAARPGGSQSYDTFNRMQFRSTTPPRGLGRRPAAEYRHALGIVDDHARRVDAAHQRVAASQARSARRDTTQSRPGAPKTVCRRPRRRPHARGAHA
jgi:hypothetical protein